MNVFVNKKEIRARAWIRIPVFMFFGFLIMSIGNSIPLGGFQFIITAGLTFLFFYVMFRGMDNRSSITLAGLTSDKKWWIELAGGIGLGAGAMALIFFVQWWGGTIEFIRFGWESTAQTFWMIPVGIFLLQMASVGFYEELMSRSYLLTNLKEAFTFSVVTPQTATIIAIALSSLLFSFAHAANPNVTFFALLNIVLAGVMLALPYVFTGRLAYSIGLHFSWNFFQGGIFGFRVSGLTIQHSVIQVQQSGNPIWTGGSFGPEGGLIGTITLLLLCIIFVYLGYKQNGKLRLHPFFKRDFLENEESLQEMK